MEVAAMTALLPNFDTAVVAEWPPGTFVENLAPGGRGRWLVTLPSHRRVDVVQPDGAHRPLVELPHPATGIAPVPGGALVLTGPLGEAGWRLLRVGTEAGVREVCELPDLRFGNGMAWAGNELLVADSALGAVFAVDPESGRARVWLHHELLARQDPRSPFPGVNGVSAHAGQVHLTSTDRGLLLRCPVDAANPAAEVEVVATGVCGDDLAATDDGALWIATHTGDSVVRRLPGGELEEVAGVRQGAAGATAVAVDPEAPEVLYATTNGGMTRSRGRAPGPGRLLRISPRAR
ncbi:hypothetical protein APASM_3988 [Actinosynnema pretiosum subsp. pretiosum]|nr:hypothetical protein APASM_3988 [Actinosynnema pretiosum subsp. pretiosum]